jgi:hypothetical protein
MIEVVGLVPSPTIGVEDNPDYLDEVRNPAGSPVRLLRQLPD